MFGWVTTAAVLRARLEECERRRLEAVTDRDYWRDKAELLLDATLFHRGEVRHHVFSKPPAPVAADPVLRALSGLSRHELSTKD